MKYALEVAKSGSINKAAEVLMVAAPNVSRSIKELETDFGITIFERTQNGTKLTPEGEEFINYAKGVLRQIDEIERFYKTGAPKKQKFSISVPRACYISEAFALFSKSLSKEAAEIFYKETNSQRTIHNMTEHDYKLGIIRYAENYDKYFKSMLEEKGFQYELVTEFTYSLIMSADNPLAKKEVITFDDLPDNIDRRIFIFERASQFDLLSLNPETFMWVSPAPQSLLERYNLVLKKCADNKKVYKDVLIYKNGYKLSKLDRQFITELCESKRKHI